MNTVTMIWSAKRVGLELAGLAASYQANFESRNTIPILNNYQTPSFVMDTMSVISSMVGHQTDDIVMLTLVES
jgi:hypothetical protein